MWGDKGEFGTRWAWVTWWVDEGGGKKNVNKQKINQSERKLKCVCVCVCERERERERGARFEESCWLSFATNEFHISRRLPVHTQAELEEYIANTRSRDVYP